MKQSKRIVIKSIGVEKSIPPDFLSSCWEKLSASFAQIYQNQPITQNIEIQYRLVEDLCINMKQQELFEKWSKMSESHLRESVKRLNLSLSEVSSMMETGPQTEIQNSQFLLLVQTFWEEYCIQMRRIRQILLPLERTYMIKNSLIKSIWAIGRQQLLQSLTKEKKVVNSIVQGILELIKLERKNSTTQNRPLLKSLIQMLLALELYKKEFEKKFLETTEDHYQRVSKGKISEQSTREYMGYLLGSIEEEMERIMAYMEDSTSRKLIKLLETSLIKDHVSTMLDKGLDIMMAENDIDNLRHIYDLFSRVGELGSLRGRFSEYIKHRGGEIIANKQMKKVPGPKIMTDIIHLKELIGEILKQSFSNSRSFHEIEKEAFEDFLNIKPNLTAEYLSTYLDLFLAKRSANMKTQKKIEETLQEVMPIFRYLKAKDIFEAFYNKKLSKRLLLNNSANNDDELQVLSELKLECGSVYTQKGEGMFKDIQLSKDVMNTYRSKESSKENEFEFQCFVLTQGHWPTSNLSLNPTLPPSILSLHNDFSQFYLERNKSRQLKWDNSMATAELMAHFPKKSVRIEMSGLQAITLLQFNENESINFKELQEKTKIEQSELELIVASFAMHKYCVLSKSGNNKHIQKSDILSVNKEFTTPYPKIIINKLQRVETKEECQHTAEKVFQERRFVLDAAIVKIMKREKSCTHNFLVSCLFQQLKFQINNMEIKKRIESLIDQEYMIRDTNHMDKYHYKA